MELFNNKEIELLRNAGVNIEDKQEFTNDDKKYIFRQVSEFLMSPSSKKGDIGSKSRLLISPFLHLFHN